MRGLLVRYPKLLGALTWLVSAGMGTLALVLADFGAPAWVFGAAGLWLWTAGLPTLAAALLVLSAWGRVPGLGTPPLWAAVAAIAILSFLAQVGSAVLLARLLRARGAAPSSA